VPETSPEERALERIRISSTLRIDTITPRQLFTNTPRLTVGYYLTCSSSLDVSEIPVKVALFLNRQLKAVREIENFPNGRTLRFSISSPVPETEGEYDLVLKVIRFDADPRRRLRRLDIYATTRERIEVKEALADLIIENFTVSEPRIVAVEDSLGEYFRVEFPVSIRVRNIGAIPAGRFDVVVNEKKAERFGEIFRESISGLNPSQSRTITGTTRGLGSIHYPEGFRLQALVDAPLPEEFASPQGQIRELNEDNNLSEIVERRLENLITIRAPLACYRGSHIEIRGNFGSSFGNKRIVLERDGSIAGYAELINFTSRRITVKIPKTDSIRTEADYRIYIATESGDKISNYQTVHIIKPVIINEVKSITFLTYSPTNSMPADILVNGCPVAVSYDCGSSVRRRTLKWAIVSSLPAREEDFRPQTELANDINLPAGRYYFVLRDFSKPYHGSGESEGIASRQITVKDVEHRRIDFRTFKGLTGLQLIVHIPRIHPEFPSYVNIAIRDGEEYRHRIDIPKECTDFIIEGPTGVRDIRHKIRIEDGGNDGEWYVSGGKIIIPLSFDTGFWNPEIKRYCRGLLGGWYDGGAYDINLTRFDMKIRFGIGTPGGPLTRSNVIHDVGLDIDLRTDISNVPDWMEVWGIVENRISRSLRDLFLPFFSSNSLKTNLYNGFMEQIRNLDDFGDVVLFSVYTEDDSFVFDFVTLE